jgi:hypothetical protein
MVNISTAVRGYYDNDGYLWAIIIRRFCDSSWRAMRVGNIRLQLAAARAVIYELDTAQESRMLSAQEIDLRKELKHAVLGLASLCRTMARQRARVRHLAEGDTCTRYFHL